MLLSDEGLAVCARLDTASLPKVPEGARLGVPLSFVPKIVCIGLNYADHAAETGAADSERAGVFMKATTSLTGPNDAVVIPRGSKKDRLGSGAGRGDRQARFLCEREQKR